MHPGFHCQQTPDKCAYVMADTGEQVSYRELDATSNQAAHLFRRRGLKPGDGIAILLHNHPEYLKIAWGAQRSGLYYTPISILFQPGEIQYILDNSDAKLLITHSEHLKTLGDNLPNLPIYLVDQPTASTISHQRLLDWRTALTTESETPVADECEGAEMIYSSGTTGQPKGVRFAQQTRPLGEVTDLFKARVAMHQVNSDTVYLSTAPLYHSAPLRYNLMVTRLGGTAVIMPKFDPEAALRLIEKHQITHSQWVPTMFVRLLKLPKEIQRRYDTSSLRYAIHAAAPCPVTVKRQMLDWWGPILFEYYSGTEANGQTAISPEEWEAHPGSVGKAIYGEIHILDEAGRELPTGETGTVYFAGGGNFSYYKDPEKTAAARNQLGWSTLGDMGYVDGDGYLYLKDRRSFMIISGGVNIYPQEVENLLVSHPLVLDVAVFGIPNSEFGEEVKAIVELVDFSLAGDQLAAELINFCRHSLSHVKCPRSIEFEEKLPRHPTGKLYKRQLRDRYWQGHQTSII